jgi:SAM-dependent methyltransferase
LPTAIEKIYALGYQSKKNLQTVESSPGLFGSLLEQMEPYRQSENLCDVGCFTGKFLLTAQEFGWDVHGLEVSDQAVEFCQTSLSLDVRHGTLQTTDFSAGSMNVITMFDVVEHLPQPLLDLKCAHTILRPGGLLYLETPNYGSLARALLGKRWRVFFPWHFYYYTARTISLLLGKAGFKIARLNAVGLGPLSTFNAYQSLKNSGNISAPSLSSNVKSSHTLKGYIPYIRKVWHIVRALEHGPFKLLSRLGIYMGGKLVVWAERVP